MGVQQEPQSWKEATLMLLQRWEPEQLRDFYDAVANGIWYPEGTPGWQRAETPDLLVRSLLGDASMGGWSANLEDTPITEAPPGLWEALYGEDPEELPRIAGNPEYCRGVRAAAGYRLTAVSLGTHWCSDPSVLWKQPAE